MSGERADVLFKRASRLAERMTVRLERVADAFVSDSPLKAALMQFLEQHRSDALLAGHDFREEGLDGCAFCQTLNDRVIPGAIVRVSDAR